METNRFAELSRIVNPGSRRGFAAALTGGSLALFGPLRGLTETEAKKKRKKKKKKKPPLALAYECPGPPEDFGTYNNISRVAQVFVAARSGTLRRIEFLVDKATGSSGDYVVQLLRVDTGTPSQAATHVLAGITIPDADVPDGESTLAAHFNGPELEAGAEYAAAIGRLVSAVRLGFFSGTGNICAGQTFAAQGGAFTEAAGQDVVVSVFVD